MRRRATYCSLFLLSFELLSNRIRQVAPAFPRRPPTYTQSVRPGHNMLLSWVSAVIHSSGDCTTKTKFPSYSIYQSTSSLVAHYDFDMCMYQHDMVQRDMGTSRPLHSVVNANLELVLIATSVYNCLFWNSQGLTIELVTGVLLSFLGTRDSVKQLSRKGLGNRNCQVGDRVKRVLHRAIRNDVTILKQTQTRSK